MFDRFEARSGSFGWAAKSGTPTRTGVAYSDSIFKQPRTSVHDLAARCARVMHERCPSKTEGAGKAGCPLHPQPRVGMKKTTRASSPQVHRSNPAFPAQWF